MTLLRLACAGFAVAVMTACSVAHGDREPAEVVWDCDHRKNYVTTAVQFPDGEVRSRKGCYGVMGDTVMARRAATFLSHEEWK